MLEAKERFTSAEATSAEATSVADVGRVLVEKLEERERERKRERAGEAEIFIMATLGE